MSRGGDVIVGDDFARIASSGRTGH